MASATRKILAVKPGETWLVLVDGEWAFDAPPQHSAVPLARSRMWLLPLLQRSRDEVEAEARELLRPGDPDLGEALAKVVEMGLCAWSDHWIASALNWMVASESERFADRLHEIAQGQAKAASQATQHTAKRLLKRQELWFSGNP